MALNNGSATDAYSGRTAYYLRLYVWRSEVDVANNRAKYSWWLRAYNPNRSKLTFSTTARPWAVNVEGSTWSGSNNLDFRGGQEYIQFGSGTTGWKNHSATGDLTVNYSASHTTPSVFGSAALSGWFASDRIAKAPSRPARATFVSATTTTIAFKISGPYNGGSPIINYDLQASRNAAFTDIVDAWTSPASNQTAGPLDPGTRHWIRYRARNAVGVSAYSEPLEASTLVALPPGISVTPTLTGTGATVTLTPPQGTSEVTKYRVERRRTATTTPVTSADLTTPSQNVSGLTPGYSYDYRVSAFFGTYQTPWSAWLTRLQPKPSTNPGDYFDGASAATDDQTFSWTGTAGKSTSRANGISPLGWAIPDAAGGTAVLQRVRGGVSGIHAALVTMLTDATRAGVMVGTAYGAQYQTSVQPNGLYYGSIFVQPSRPQRMAVVISWRDSGGTQISTSTSDGVLVSPDGLTRLTVSGYAPSNAAVALIRAIDVEGAGHSLWKGGESFYADGMMITMGDLYPYFDGSTPDDASFTYDWTGAVGLSTSVRENADQQGVDLLVDPDCPPLPTPPAPPVVDSGCIEEVGIWRRYWFSVPASEVQAWRTMVTTIELRTGLFPARQVRIRVRPNPFDYNTNELEESDWCSEQIVSYMPAGTTLTLDGLMERVWAEVQGSNPVAADHLLYGTGGVPATWPELSCSIGYFISLDVPLDAPESNLDIGVSLTPRG